MSKNFSRCWISYSPTWLIVLALLSLGANSVAFALCRPTQNPDEGTQPNARRIIGLLEMPSVFRPHESDVPADAPLSDHNEPIRAYAKASSKSGMVAMIQTPEDIETRNDPYRRPGAVVYDVNRDWYLIGLKSRSGVAKGWVFTKNSNAFSWIDGLMLLADNSGYLTDKWDGNLWTKPGVEAGVNQIKEPATRDITVRDTRRIDDDIWLEVEITKQTTCDDNGEEYPVIARGWIRTHTVSDDLQVWFYPRGGC
jgi:hypothetical protein